MNLPEKLLLNKCQRYLENRISEFTEIERKTGAPLEQHKLCTCKNQSLVNTYFASLKKISQALLQEYWAVQQQQQKQAQLILTAKSE